MLWEAVKILVPSLACGRIQWYLAVTQDECALPLTCGDRVKMLAQGRAGNVTWGWRMTTA